MSADAAAGAPPRRRSTPTGGGADGDGDGDGDAMPPLFPVYALSGWVRRRTMTPYWVAAHAALVAALHFRAMPHLIDRVAGAQRAALAHGTAPPMPAGPLLPDFRLFGFSAETLDRTFAAYGPAGRRAYADLLRADGFYIVGWALFFGDVQAIAAKLAGVRRNPWRALHLLPWVAAAFDALEDALLGAALCAFDPATGRVEPGAWRAAVSALASGACQLKWIALAAFLGALALTLGRGVVRLGLFLGGYVCGRRGGGGGPSGGRGRRGGGGRGRRSHRHGGGSGGGGDHDE